MDVCLAWVVLKNTGFLHVVREAPEVCCLCAFTTDAARQLDVLRHNGYALCVDSAEVRVLEQAYKIGFCSLLQRQHGLTLETKVRLEVLGNLANQSLERQLPDEQLSALLVFANLTKSDLRLGTSGAKE